MYLALTDEQSFLQEAAQDALSRLPTREEARAALDGEAVPSRWDLAVEAGWTGLLSGEEVDGVGLGAYEALLVLECCGRVLADAHLLGHLPAAAVLEAAGSDTALRRALASGQRRAALVDARLGERSRALTLVGRGSEVEITGEVRSVVDADGADVFVVVGESEDGTRMAAIVEAGEGMSVRPQEAYDATRALATVSFAGAAGSMLELSAAQLEIGCALQRALLAAESVGAADACLTMARDYAVDRVAFARPIGSYQAIKHKIVEMLRHVEGSRSLLVAAGQAWDRKDLPGFVLAAAAARVASTEALDYSAPENIFIHGGVGATWEHDCSLYYRRAELSRRLAGGADAAAEAVAEALLAAA